MVHNNLKQHEKALAELLICEKIDPLDFEIQNNIGFTLTRLGRTKDAILSGQKAYEIAKRLMNKNLNHKSLEYMTVASTNLAIYLSEDDQEEEALGILITAKDAISRYNNKEFTEKYLPVVLFRLGYIAAENQRHEVAEESFKESIAIKDNEGAYGLGKLY